MCRVTTNVYNNYLCVEYLASILLVYDVTLFSVELSRNIGTVTTYW